MTKKDFELIATIICDQTYQWRAIASPTITLLIRERIARSFAKKLVTNNPKFDPIRFMVACGIPEADMICKDCFALDYLGEKECERHQK